MINFNHEDDEMAAIERVAAFKEQTKISYRIHGLRQIGRPQIKIEYDNRYINPAQAEWLVKFFKAKKLECVVKPVDERGNYQLYLGIRRDLRDNHKLCAAIVQTVVYYLEGILKTNKPKKGRKTT